MFGKLLCECGFHKFRERKNGNTTERCCMRDGCNYRESLYRMKDGDMMLWNKKKIPVRSSWFKKVIKK
jgi:hypothetical protein